MARITKAALEQQVADMQAQINTLNAALAQAQAALALASEHVALRDAQHAASTQPTHRVAYAMPAWQAERAAAMAAAKGAAMRLGVTTKVAAC